MYPFGPSKVLCKLQPFEIQQVGLDIIEEEKVCVFQFADGIRLRNQNLFNLLINLLSLQPFVFSHTYFQKCQDVKHLTACN